MSDETVNFSYDFPSKESKHALDDLIMRMSAFHDSAAFNQLAVSQRFEELTRAIHRLARCVDVLREVVGEAAWKKAQCVLAEKEKNEQKEVEKRREFRRCKMEDTAFLQRPLKAYVRFSSGGLESEDRRHYILNKHEKSFLSCTVSRKQDPIDIDNLPRNRATSLLCKNCKENLGIIIEII